ncbi:MAG: aminopeptidase P family protein [Tyzzerella sp.]|nr:aminopeptidase P family protein [Tyzzerella sp.]
MTIQQRITALRQLMKEKNIDAYIVPSSDNHQSEYVGDYFKAREFITGFTGSAGTAVITQTEAGLWTDGRYFIQAEKELAGSGVKLYKMGNPDVPTVEEYLEAALPENGVLGFDGRVIAMSKGKEYAEKFAYKNVQIEANIDLIDEIWSNRPAMSEKPVFLLGEAYTGESTASKLERVREEMKKAKATTHLLITLDDIAWLLNMRGSDIAYTPVVLCYAIVKLDCVHLFINAEKLSSEIKDNFKEHNILLHPYNDVYTFTQNLSPDEVVLFDPARLNYALYNIIPNSVKRVAGLNPCILMKAVKNDVEVENIKKAHVKDAVAHTKFMYWLKNTIGKESITELSASDKLYSLRKEQENFLWPSFDPISAFGPNAAMCHYSSSEETNVELEEGFLYLSDTGGNYMEGSTDITRTYAIGEINASLKRDYTNVLRGNLALSNAKFLYGCTGQNVDILARQYLWNNNLDYKHGTGHGVGYLLSIHETSARINWQGLNEVTWKLEHGMVITNEPGIYIEGSHGIRLENELLVRKAIANEYGQFMHFEVITYVPFDLDAIDSSLLRDDEKAQLNAYHKLVFDTVSPYLSDNEREWLEKYTRAI